MKEKLVKYLLLSIVLLTGYSQLYAYFSGSNTNINISNNNFKQTDNAHYTYVAKSSLYHFEKFNCEIEITDREDDEITSLKKNFTASPFFCRVTSIPNTGYMINHIPKTSLFNKFSHLISCKRYLLLRVIRI